MKNDLVGVCKLGKTVGLRGALKLHNFSDFPNQFKKGVKFYAADGREFVVKSYNSTSSLIVFEGFESVELAASLVNLTLYRSAEDTRKHCKLGKDEFFYFDVIDCEIFEGDSNLGVVRDILEAGGGYLFEVVTADKLVKDGLAQSFYIPYNDHFVLSIDVAAKKILVENSLAILENS